MTRNIDDPRDNEERKRLVKEAIDEWLDKKFTQFGKYSFMGIVAAGIAVVGYYFFTTHGIR